MKETIDPSLSKDNNGGSLHNISPYPTTFVQANTNNFKQVVQMLTGSPQTAQSAYRASLISSSDHQQQQNQQQQPPPCPVKGGGYIIPPIKTGPPQKKQGFKLYERRNTLKNGLIISPLIGARFGQNSIFSPRKKEILSPSILDFPALALSPVTPLNADPFNRSPSSIGSSSTVSSSEEEEKAIAEKKFYLHPSPRTNTPRGSEPQLLPLFPVNSED